MSPSSHLWGYGPGHALEPGNLYGAMHIRRALGQPLRSAVCGNLTWVHRFELASILKGHQGCVNTIQWSSDGRLLVSGSDDRCVKLWDFHKSRVRSGGEAPPICSLRTLHRHNIFDAQLTRSQQQIVSCGADGCVCLTQVETAVDHCVMLYGSEPPHNLASKLAFCDHNGGEVFLVTFRDGRVRMFDLRESGHRVALDCNRVGLTGIELQPTSRRILAVGGNDRFLRIYDLRSLSFRRESSAREGATPALSIHSSEKLVSNESRHWHGSHFSDMISEVGISGVSWNQSGTKILANYRSSDVVLFDMAPEGSGERLYKSVPVSSLTLEPLDNLDLPCDSVRLNVLRSFEGRVNVETCAKEVRFLCGDAAVATGGDCGGFFIWETSTGSLLRKLPADRCVVNCVAPHPTLPLTCTSGIDDEIKVWDVGDERVCEGESRKRKEQDLSCSSSNHDWERRRREGAPNVTSAEAETKLRNAECLKQTGNNFIKEADWTSALEKYTEATTELHFLAPNSETKRAQETLMNSCCLNSAFCHLNLEEYSSASIACSTVLDNDPHNVKALFRRSTARGELCDFEGAFADVEAALTISPANTDVLRLKQKLQKQQRKHRKREQKMYMQLFAGGESDKG